MDALRFRGPVLPDGEGRDLYVVDGGSPTSRSRRPSWSPRAGSFPGWSTRTATSASTRTARCRADVQEQQALTDRDAGALLLRDCGSAADTAWIHDRDDLPRLIRAGRHLARTRRYIRNYAHEIEPEDLPAYVAQEAERGDGWVKLVGDWIERDAGDLDPVVDPRVARRGDAGRPRPRRPGHRARLRRGRAAGPDRLRHRLHRARHRAVDRPDRHDGRQRGGAGARPSSSSATSRTTPTPAARSSRRTPTT